MWKRRTAYCSVIALLGGLTASWSSVCHGFQPPSPGGMLSTRSIPHRMPIATTSADTREAFPRVTAGSATRQHGATTTRLSAAASPLLALASSPVGAISVLASIVLIHEAGHYLAARSFGIAVEEFSVGVGPKILGFQAFGDDFSLRALPLGGYVRFPENYNVTLVEELRAQAIEQAKAERDKEQETTNNKPGKQLGNALLNIATLGAAERKRKEEQAAAQAQAEDQQPWWKKLQNEEKLNVPEVEIPYYDDPKLLQNRPWQERAVVLSGGVINIGEGIPSPVFEPGIVVSSAPRAQAASEGLLKKGDVILDINGHPLTQSASPTVFESQRAINDFISEIRTTPNGEDIKLTVMRDNQRSEVVRIKPIPVTGGTAGAPSIGVLLSPNYVKSAVMKTSNLGEAARLAASYTATLTRETANGLFSVIANAFKSNGSSGVQVSGPIGLIKTGSDVVATQDLAAVLLFAAALSINLGVINALPLPALDGGQLVFVIAEALTGRKVDQRLQEGITSVAVVFLLLISLSAAVGDLSNLVVGR